MKAKNRGRKKIQKSKIRKYRRYEPQYNFLKWFRVVRRWAVANYDISLEDLEFLFYLYDMELFNYRDFMEMDAIFRWDKKRFARLKNEGWIDFWGRSEDGIKLYEVSYKTRRLVNGFYKKLQGLELIAESPRRNECAKRSKYSDKVTMNMIEKFNKDQIKQNTKIIKPL